MGLSLTIPSPICKELRNKANNEKIVDVDVRDDINAGTDEKRKKDSPPIKLLIQMGFVGWVAPALC